MATWTRITLSPGENELEEMLPVVMVVKEEHLGPALG